MGSTGRTKAFAGTDRAGFHVSGGVMLGISGVRRVAAAIVALVLAYGAAAGERQYVVMQINDDDATHWRQALGSVRNLLTDVGKDNVQIEIVAYGPGIHMLRFDSVVGPQLADLSRDGVWLRACGNTLAALKLRPGDLHAGVEIVPSGVVEILKRQKEGWAYIKP
jgi:intracellular sulfur oxidation DsrE/DsrF family protein